MTRTDDQDAAHDQAPGDGIVLTGSVIRLMLDKGFGFLRPVNAGSDSDVFFHRSALRGLDFTRMYVGQSVAFEEGTGTKGPRARIVRAA